MTAGDRFKQWIDSTASGWADRLAAWGMGLLARGITKAAEDREPEIISMTRELLTRIRDTPGMPEEYRTIIDKALLPGAIGDVIAGWCFTVIGVIMSVLSWGSIPAKVVGYAQDRVSLTFRLDPMSVITAWRRDPKTYNKYFDDLRDQGWDEDRIEALKFFTEFMPSAQDLVNWQAKEVFEPDMIAKYGLDDEFEQLDLTLFGKIGVTEEQARNYWRAHWQHASWIQVVDMMRRGQLKEEDIRDWFRLVEIPPYWRDKLMAISWEVPTRVDVRRFWDMRTIDEARLREIYTAQGYHGKDLDDYVLWTKVYVAFPDLMARFKNNWLELKDVKLELVALGMSEDRVEEIIQTKVKAVASEKMAKDKDLTAAEIVKGVKREIITWEQGSELLQELGYDEWEAEFKLAIDVAVETGSPESYSEFKSITQKYRDMVAPAGKREPEALKKAALELAERQSDVDALARAVKEEKGKLMPEEGLPEDATKRLTELEVALHRAEAALQVARTNYNALRAEWRQKLS